MKNLLRSASILAAFALVFTSCSQADQTYDKNGLSFTYPGGWSITDDEFAESVGYLALEKNGSNPKATIIFGWIEKDVEIAADMMLASIFQEMRAGAGSFTDFVPADAVDTTYGAYPARAITYTATVAGVATSGAVWVFKAEGRVVNVAISEGADKTNVAAFKTIKDSFTLK